MTDAPISEEIPTNELNSDKSDAVNSSSNNTPTRRKLRPDLRVSPSAEYVGIQLSNDQLFVESIAVPGTSAVATSSSRMLLESADEPISPATFLESSFLWNHLADGGLSPDRAGSDKDRVRPAFRISASNTPMGEANGVTYGFSAETIKWKLQAPEVTRDRTVEERKQKARIVSHRAKVITEKQAVRLAKAEVALDTQLRGAEQRHAEYVKAIKGRAGNENAKVSEVHFINTINEEHLVAELQQRLEEVEARILAAANRRSERLQDIAVQQKKRNHKKIQQMSELRLQLERQRMERWERLQQRIEAVQRRREARLLEMSRRSIPVAEQSIADPLPSPDGKKAPGASATDTSETTMLSNKPLSRAVSADKFSPESTIVTPIAPSVAGNAISSGNSRPPLARASSASRRQSTDGGMSSVLKATASSEAKTKAKKVDSGSSKGVAQSGSVSETKSVSTKKKKAKETRMDSGTSICSEATVISAPGEKVGFNDRNDAMLGGVESIGVCDCRSSQITGAIPSEAECIEGVTSTESTPAKSKKAKHKKRAKKKVRTDAVDQEIVDTESVTEYKQDVVPVDVFEGSYRSWQAVQMRKEVTEARTAILKCRISVQKDPLSASSESDLAFGVSAYSDATTSLSPSSSEHDHEESKTYSDRVLDKPLSLANHIDQLRALLLSHEPVLRATFVTFNSTAFRGTIAGSAESNSDPELTLRHLWVCAASILGSPQFRETTYFERLWSFRLAELLAAVLDESHGILSSATRFRFAVEQPGLLFSISACVRSAVLLDGACALLLEKHSKLLSQVVDLASLLLQWTNHPSTLAKPNESQTQVDLKSVKNTDAEAEADADVGSMSVHLRVTVLQSLSILLNALHFLPQYLDMPDFTFASSSKSQLRQQRMHIKQKLTQTRWTDAQSCLVWYMSCSQLLVGAIEYLHQFSVPFLQREWNRQTLAIAYDSRQVIESLPLNMLARPDGWTDVQFGLFLAEYEMLCGGLELCGAVTSYLRLSAGVSDFTLVRDYDQLHVRRHRHPRGRQMLSSLAGGPHPSLLSVLSQVLGATYRLHSSDTCSVSGTPDEYAAGLRKMELTWSLFPSFVDSITVSDALRVVLDLVVNALCAVSEADIGLHRGLTKLTRAELVAHCGALLALSSASGSDSQPLRSLQHSALRLVGLIYLSAPSESLPLRMNAQVIETMLVTRQEGLLLSKQTLIRLQELLFYSIAGGDCVVTIAPEVYLGFGSLNTAALLRAVLLSLLHSSNLLPTDALSSEGLLDQAVVTNIREYFELQLQELNAYAKGSVTCLDDNDGDGEEWGSKSQLALLSHVAPVSLWTLPQVLSPELNQIM